MKLIESKTLGTAQASIEFTSIPQDGTDLVAVCSLRLTGAGSDNVSDSQIKINGSSANFTYRYLLGTGNGGVASAAASTVGLIGFEPSSTSTANTFGSTLLYIPNYTGATNKSYSTDSVAENNATITFASIIAGLWSNTAAINSLEFLTGSGGNLAAGSTISLYKITKGSDGIVTTSP
jgi:hypothetical protein